MNPLEKRIKLHREQIDNEVNIVRSKSGSDSVRARLTQEPADDGITSWTDGWDKGWNKYGKTMAETETIKGSAAPSV